MPSLSKKKFKELYDKITGQFEAECKASGEPIDRSRKYQYYGYESDGNWKKEEPSIWRNMKRHSDVDTFLNGSDIKGKYLSDRKRQYDAPHQSDVKMRLFNLEVYCLYIGEKDRINYYLSQEVLPKDIKKQYFEGFYYSYYEHVVKTFHLQLEYTDNKEIEFIRVIQSGYHEDKQRNPFRGRAKRTKNILYVNMTNENEDEMKIITKVIYDNPQQWNFLSCAISTISSSEFPINSRGLLVKKEAPEVSPDKRIVLTAKRFHMLKRNTFRASPEAINRTNDIKFRRLLMSQLSIMVGVWRIWRYSARDKIIQSKLVIEEDYQAKLYSAQFFDDNLKEQTVTLNVGTEKVERLCITTHPKVGSSILAYGIIGIPTRKQNSILLGAYASALDVSSEVNNPQGGIMVWKRESDFDNFEPEELELKNMKEMLVNNADMNLMKTKLDTALKRITPKD